MTTHLVNIFHLIDTTQDIIIKCFEFGSSIKKKINGEYVRDVNLNYNLLNDVVEVYINGNFHSKYPYQEGKDKFYLKAALSVTDIKMISEISNFEIDDED